MLSLTIYKYMAISYLTTKLKMNGYLILLSTVSRELRRHNLVYSSFRKPNDNSSSLPSLEVNITILCRAKIM